MERPLAHLLAPARVVRYRPVVADIVLATQNARYAHTALGLRALQANLGELAATTVLCEHTLEERPAEIAEAILRHHPSVLGLGAYVWNARESLALARLVKTLRPELRLVLGGPEVSFCRDSPLIALADHVVQGEGELAFRALAGRLLAGGDAGPKLVPGGEPDLGELLLPYALYSDKDLAERVVYLEASRGCPYGCEFCLSALTPRVRRFPEAAVHEALSVLWARGLRRFRFVDRTFNLGDTGVGILEHLLALARGGEIFVHLEVVPDHISERLWAVLSRFSAGSLQLEVGVQTLAEEVAQRIHRRQQPKVALAVIRRLRAETAAHVHADLIVGLPGEGVESLARGFDELLAAGPHEIQLGILKRLPGAPIARHDEAWGMVYNPDPPYDILENGLIDFATMQRLKRAARLWDHLGNSGNFRESAPLLLGRGSPFVALLAFADWLAARRVGMHALGLERLVGLVHAYLTTERGLADELVRASLQRDWTRSGRRPLSSLRLQERARRAAGVRPKRQERHR